MAETAPAATDVLKGEIASLARSLTITYGGNGLAQPDDDTLRSRGSAKGLKLYDEIERDPHAFAVLQKRKLAVVAREWTVVPATDQAADVAAAELVEGAIDGVTFDKATGSLMDAVLKGFAIAEILWEERDGRFVPGKIKARNQTRFVFDLDGRPRLRTMEEPVKGIELPERKFIVHRYGAKDENPYGLGLGTILFWPTWFKRHGIGFWLKFIEKYAQPTAIGEYPATAQKDQQDKLLAALSAITRDTAIIMPQGMVARFLEAARSGTADYEPFCRYMDEQISETVLGETLSTTQGSVGSQALGTVHNDVRQELTDADCDLVSETLNETLVKWIVELNLPNAKPPKVWRAKPEDEAKEEDLKTRRTDRVGKIHALGFRLADEEAYERMLGEKVVRATDAPGAEFAEGSGRDAIDELVAALAEGDGWRQVIGPTIADLEGRLKAARSPEEAREILTSAFADLDVDALREKLAGAIFTTWLAGEAGAKISDRV